MMGQLSGGQQRLFYSFNADFYSPIGRSSIDPELMVRILVVGYIKAGASRQRGLVGDEIDWNDPKLSSRAVREYLEGFDEDALTGALPKKTSLTGPLSLWAVAPRLI